MRLFHLCHLKAFLNRNRLFLRAVQGRGFSLPRLDAQLGPVSHLSLLCLSGVCFV